MLFGESMIQESGKASSESTLSMTNAQPNL